MVMSGEAEASIKWHIEEPQNIGYEAPRDCQRQGQDHQLSPQAISHLNINDTV